MHLSQLFRSLEPSRLNLRVGEFEGEPGFYDGLIELEAPGLVALVTAKGKFASLKAGLTSERVSVSGQAICGTLAGTNSDSHGGFSTFLAFLQFPFTPLAGFKLVGESLDPEFSRLLTTKPKAQRRQICGLNEEGIAISCEFLDNQLTSIKLIDLYQKILSHQFRDLPPELVAEQRENHLDRLKHSPESVFFHYMGSFDADSIEWQRGFVPGKRESSVQKAGEMASEGIRS
ncbi:MAG: hypothetical protein P1V20_18785 [Verrucomicrobiales bacterium]|nr:hypothetical protein [Verrucomicrobiales bacterium]